MPFMSAAIRMETFFVWANSRVLRKAAVMISCRRSRMSCSFQKYFWKEQDIRDRLHEIITAAFRRTLEFAQTKKVSMRMAALMNGINKIVQAHLARGLYP